MTTFTGVIMVAFINKPSQGLDITGSSQSLKIIVQILQYFQSVRNIITIQNLIKLISTQLHSSTLFF